MKINTIYALLQIFLICSYSVLAVKDQIRVSGILSRRNHRVSKSKNINQKFNIKSCENSTIDFIAFIKGIFISVNESLHESLAGFIVDKFKLKEGTEQCFKMVGEAFDAKIQKAEKEVEILAKEGLNKVFDQIKNLNVKIYNFEFSLLENLRGNPKEFCRTAKKTIKFKIRDSQEAEQHLKKVINYLEDPEKQSWTLKDWEEFKKGILNIYETREEIYDRLKNGVNKHPEMTLNNVLHGVLEEYKKEYKKIERLISDAKPIINLKCKNLPDEKNYQTDCYQVGIGIKARQFWELMTNPDSIEITNCLKKFLTEMIFNKLISVTVKAILNIILNAFGIFAATLIKVLLYVMILIDRVIKATKSKNVKEKSLAMGEAIGYAYHIVKVILQVGKRRLLKLRR